MEVTEGQQGEINTTEDILLHFFKRRRHTMPHMATWEDIKFWSGVRMEQGEILDWSLYWDFCSRGEAEEGKQHRAGWFK